MNNYELVRNIATLLIEKLQGERSITPEDISQQVDLAIQSPGAEPLSDVERKKLIAELESYYQTVIGVERELLGDDEGWEAWLPDRRAEIGWKYWDRYRKYLSRKSFPKDVLNRLETSTDRVLGLLGSHQRRSLGPAGSRG